MNGVVARRNNFNEQILRCSKRPTPNSASSPAATLRLRSRIQDRGCRHGVRFARLRRGQHRSRRATTSANNARGKVGSIHINVIRPFPEAAVINALRGKKNVIILERTDEGLAGDNPLARDIRVALGKAHEVEEIRRRSSRESRPTKAPHLPRRLRHRLARFPSRTHAGRVRIRVGQTARKDGAAPPTAKRTSSSASITLTRSSARTRRRSFPRRRDRGAIPLHRRLGHDHDRQKSRLDHRRLRASSSRRKIPSWTKVAALVAEAASSWRIRNTVRRKKARPPITISPSRRIADQSELRTQPRRCRALLRSESVHPHQSARRPEKRRLPRLGIRRVTRSRVATRAGEIPPMDSREQHSHLHPPRLRHRPQSHGPHRAATPHAGKFIPRRVLPRLAFPEDQQHLRRTFPRKVVHKQYVKKFGRFGDAVVASNMTVMNDGFSRVQEIRYGEMDDPDRSTMRNPPLRPLGKFQFLPTAGLRQYRHAASRCLAGSFPARRSRPPRSSIPNSVAASAIINPPARLPPSASWAPAPAPRNPNTSPAAKRPFTSRKIARNAWSASPRARTPRCPTRRRKSAPC